MYLKKTDINTTALANGGSNFGGSYYWSSTEADPNIAWDQSFDYGYQGGSTKANANYVRAVRAF